jgi:hypothetical protein
MQPNQQNNYWQHDTDDDANKIADSYTPQPQPDDEDPIVEDDKYQVPKMVDSQNIVHWSADEYINQEHSLLWFVAFVAVVLGLIAMDIFMMKSYTFSVLVVIMAITVIILIRRPSQTVNYTLSADHGLYIGEKLYNFDEFKSFGIIRDSGRNSIMLIPVKRFAAGVSVYFPDDVGERIVDIIGARLPMVSQKLDIVDVIVRKLRL